MRCVLLCLLASLPLSLFRISFSPKSRLPSRPQRQSTAPPRQISTSSSRRWRDLEPKLTSTSSRTWGLCRVFDSDTDTDSWMYIFAVSVPAYTSFRFGSVYCGALCAVFLNLGSSSVSLRGTSPTTECGGALILKAIEYAHSNTRAGPML
jgi:hypothetical protein